MSCSSINSCCWWQESGGPQTKSGYQFKQTNKQTNKNVLLSRAKSHILISANSQIVIIIIIISSSSSICWTF